MNTTLSAEYDRRECYSRAGWNITDDDVPRVPELNPLQSAQCRRWLREEQEGRNP